MTALALEMALHEEAERQAMEEELTALLQRRPQQRPMPQPRPGGRPMPQPGDDPENPGEGPKPAEPPGPGEPKPLPRLPLEIGKKEPPIPPEMEPGRALPGSGALLLGDKGVMLHGSHGADGVRLVPETRMQEYKRPPKTLPRVAGTHEADWIRACKGGQASCSNFSVAAPFVQWMLLGAIAMRYEGKLEWDAAKKQFRNNKEANSYLKPVFRKGWKFAG